TDPGATMKWAIRLCALVAPVALLACGSGDHAPTTSMPAPAEGDPLSSGPASPGLQSANIEGCGAARIYDTGHIVYLTVPRTCTKTLSTYGVSTPAPTNASTSEIPLRGVLAWGTSNSTVPHEVEFANFGAAIRVEFEPG